jgi:AcrR family transcriptional regulator
LVLNPVQIRSKKAAATRAALLKAARGRFAALGYDGTGLREIAADAGVDAALVCRYFGSKDELFAEVLASFGEKAWLRGESSTFGERIAGAIFEGPYNPESMEGLLVMLRSIGSGKAQDALNPWCDTCFHQPLKETLGGEEDADVRARLAGALLLGVAVTRALRPDFGLDEAGQAKLRERLARMLQACAAP